MSENGALTFGGIIVVLFYLIGPEGVFALTLIVVAVVTIVDVVKRQIGAVGMGAVDETTAAQQAYVAGEIDEDELERRLFLAEDPRASVVVEAVSAIDGVGERRAAALAERFASPEDVAAADVQELVAVEHVGEATAKRLHEKLR